MGKYEWFHEQLQDEEGFASISKANCVAVFDSLVAKAKEQDEDVEKNAKKNRKQFVELLQKAREVTASTTYEMAEKTLGNSAAWDAVDDQTRRQCFNIFVDQLKLQSGGVDDDDSAEAERRKKKKNKRKEASPEEEEEPPKKSKKE